MPERRNTTGYIVLAEDNPADVYLVREALHKEKIDCALKVFSDGEEAMRFVENLDVDSSFDCPEVLLLDLHLPKKSGVDILKQLRASERCGHTPVVVLTSSHSMRDLDSSGLHYFRKPSSLDQFMKLGQIVKQIMNRSGPETPCRRDIT